MSLKEQPTICPNSPTSITGGDNYPMRSHAELRKEYKRKTNCKCRRSHADEAHWSKLLQTCQVSKQPSPSVMASPPLSPITAISQSLSRFFRRFNTSKKTATKDNTEESNRLGSISSEDSGLCSSSPILQSFSEASQVYCEGAAKNDKLDVKPVVVLPVHEFQKPSSSTLLARRLHNRVQKPATFVLSENSTKVSNTPGLVNLKLSQGNIRVPGQQSPSNCHSPLAIAASCPLQKNETLTARDMMARTWPPLRHHLTYDDDDRVDVYTEGKIYMNEARNVEEFRIAPEDTLQEELVGHWKGGGVYRGKWHGDVMIQTYEVGGQISKEFWEEVKKMSRIRHENIALFMGACTSPGNLALVTGVCMGNTLYKKLHISREKTTLAVKISISYQILQALAYLHAKRIVYRILSTRNVFVEKQKVILSVINFASLQKAQECGGDMLREQLPYIAPEIVETLDMTSDGDCSFPGSPQADIYAFGILLHELISSKRPFRNIPARALAAQVCQGRRPATDVLVCPQPLKALMKSCWTGVPARRPYTHDILKTLQKKEVTLHNRFSSSEPDSINKQRGYHL
ncbi:kinase suppressor of Ras 1-like [Watersipora subatra]|uniref:kinase suppressor of Ras 1-like n=1 Tax=Watersipora subatra TaxID=2589382 RepID=UPI00355B214C